MRGQHRRRVYPRGAHAGHAGAIGKGAGIGFTAIDPIGIGGQGRNAAQPINRQGKGQQKFAVAPPAPARAAQCYRGLAPRQHQCGALKGAPARGNFAGQRGVHPAHIARFALDRIRQDMHPQPRRLGKVASRLERLRRRGNNPNAMARKSCVAGGGRIFGRAVQKLRHRLRQLYAIGRHQPQRQGAIGGIWHGGPAGHLRRVIAWHIRHNQCVHRGWRGQGRQPPALYGAKLFANGIHRPNGRPRCQKRRVQRRLIGQGKARRGGRQQGRTAATDQRHNQIIRPKPLHRST